MGPGIGQQSGIDRPLPEVKGLSSIADTLDDEGNPWVNGVWGPAEDDVPTPRIKRIDNNTKIVPIFVALICSPPVPVENQIVSNTVPCDREVSQCPFFVAAG